MITPSEPNPSVSFGLSFLPDARPEARPAAEYFANALELCDRADEMGLHTVKMTEHYLHPYGGYCPSPLAFLAAVAARTRRVRLMTGCVLPAFHHPIQLAAEAAMVDALSGGRLDVGFARAYLPYEFDAFGIDLDESRARYEATISAVMRLWTEARVTIQSPFFAFREVESLPRPVQTPHPPVWGAAVKSRQSFAWLAEQGMNLLVTPPPGPLGDLAELLAIYRETFADAHGGSRPAGRIALNLPLYLAEDEGSARREGEACLQRYMEVWASAADSWTGRHSSAYPGYSGMARGLRASTPAMMVRNGEVLIGGPGPIAERLAGVLDLLGPDLVLLQIDFGAQPLRTALRTLELFVGEVLPSLRIPTGTASPGARHPLLPRTGLENACAS